MILLLKYSTISDQLVVSNSTIKLNIFIFYVTIIEVHFYNKITIKKIQKSHNIFFLKKSTKNSGAGLKMVEWGGMAGAS